MDERAAALEARIATLEKQNAVLEAGMASKYAILDARITSMQGDSTETTKLLKEVISEIHGIREKIAFSKGAWWMGVLLLTTMAAIAGGAGALVHRMTSGQP